MRVGENVDIKTVTKQVLIEKGGVAKSADFVAAGIRAVDVVNLCNAGSKSRHKNGHRAAHNNRLRNGTLFA